MVALHSKFWPRVDMSGGRGACWLWTGSKSSTGYGNLKHKGRVFAAHRVSYELTHGPIPAGALVCHVQPEAERGVTRFNLGKSAREHRLAADPAVSAASVARGGRDG